MIDTNEQFHRLINKELRKSHTHGVLLGVQSADGRVNFRGGGGGGRAGSPLLHP